MKKQIVFGIALIPVIAFAQTQPKPALKDVNAKSMTAAVSMAGTRIEDKNALGGFSKSDNLPRPVGKMKVENGKVYLRANPNQPTVFAGKYKGMTLLLINTTNSTKEFQASDSRLNIVQEALNEQGKWKPIEFLPSSWCGNSYHKVFAGSNEYWSFAVPRYKGTFKTKLRFRLSDESMSLLSNEFEGSVNTEQFSPPKEASK